MIEFLLLFIRYFTFIFLINFIYYFLIIFLIKLFTIILLYYYFSFDFSFYGYKLTDYENRCARARSAALIRASGAGARMVTFYYFNFFYNFFSFFVQKLVGVYQTFLGFKIVEKLWGGPMGNRQKSLLNAIPSSRKCSSHSVRVFVRSLVPAYASAVSVESSGCCPTVNVDCTH